MSVNDNILSAIFHDETPFFRSPVEPNPGDSISIRLRVAKDSASRVIVLFDTLTVATLMHKIKSDDFFDYYQAEIVCNKDEIIYRFLIESVDGVSIAYDKVGPRIVDYRTLDFSPIYSFRFIPGFHVPDWAKGAVQYQIFVDRFCNGDPSNDVVDNEYYYTIGHAKHAPEWDAVPSDTDFRCFYGGDIQGIIDKLDYLQDLGVRVLYLNPIFVSPSSHKYDCQDYEHIDPHFGIIVDDEDHIMAAEDKNNATATKYVRRVTAMENLHSR